MTESDDTSRFLRTAIKTGLRLQQRAPAVETGNDGSPRSEGVAVLQRIRASLKKRQKGKHLP